MGRVGEEDALARYPIHLLSAVGMDNRGACKCIL